MVDLWPVQQAVFEALDEAPKTYPVFDVEPPPVTGEYIVIGEPTQIPDLELDVDSSSSTLMLHGFTREPGAKTALAIQEFIRSRVNNVDIGAGVWDIHEEFSTVLNEGTPDKPLFHAIVRYRIRHN